MPTYPILTADSNPILTSDGHPILVNDPIDVTIETRRLRRFLLPFDEDVWIFLSKLEILIQSGVGLVTGQGSDPQIRLRLSRDGGETWGQEISCSAGQMGEYDARVIFRRLGRGRNLVAEITVSDPVLWEMLEAYADGAKGTS